MKTLCLYFVSILSLSFAHAATHEVKMLNNGKDGIMAFDPPYLQVKKGDTVKFLATDPAHDSASVAIPKGAKPWASPVGKGIDVKMTHEGVYLYECRSHIPMAMIGVIQVGPDKSNLADVKKSGEELAKKFVMNKERLDKYLSQIK